MTELEEFRKYWDEWHTEWLLKVRQGSSNGTISGWPLPENITINGYEIWNYFPEPYWGGSNNDLKGIFLSINPGKISEYQRIGYQGRKLRADYKLYFHNKYSYFEKIFEISKNKKNYTIKWMYKRINWLNKIFKSSHESFDIDNVLLVDLIPWHTANKKQAEAYFKNPIVKTQIIRHILLPIMEISKRIKGPLKCKILIRGTNIFDVLNDLFLTFANNDKDILKFQVSKDFVVLRKEREFYKFQSLLTAVSIDDVTLFIFSGGYSMNMPDINSIVCSVNTKSQNSDNLKPCVLKKFIKNYKNKL